MISSYVQMEIRKITVFKERIVRFLLLLRNSQISSFVMFEMANSFGHQSTKIKIDNTLIICCVKYKILTI